MVSYLPQPPWKSNHCLSQILLAMTMAIAMDLKVPGLAQTQLRPFSPLAKNQLSLNLAKSDEEDEETYEIVRKSFDQAPQPFKVTGIPFRSTSKNANLTENELRGMAILKQQLSMEELSLSRESSPVPSSSATEATTRAFINRIDELNTLTNSLQINLNDALEEQQNIRAERDRLLRANEELRHQNQDLQSKMTKLDKDYEVMSKNFFEHVRMIRATDDDHSTINERLTHLKAAIEHLIRKTQGTRSVNLNRTAAINHFRASGLLDDFPLDECTLEPFHLNLYMESVVMSALVKNFFDKPLCCVFDYNKGFKEIYDWMYKRNDRLAVRWRQQLCVMITQDPETKARQEAAVTAAASALNEIISRVYTNANEGAKIRDLCSKAFELAVAMTGLENVIAPVSVPLGIPFDEETMATSLKSNPAGTVALVIFPGFKDSVNAFNIGPKVWCY
ncbi:hypothetical protein BCR41DRAFT_351934 [Lobosporangium transversale]|uniref:Uncharacterized protein n=1 Tax=Lobosporangium transversale TaxID=64571 RepID=A0A1Y2GQY8_9FUNG|nr:hypothetical protein BCR41DRAFT_351934 [Lobosporangium transversale]ORZ19299.1 hypothetical protein BCR41DRAFT_351934 [Lobosporangium transversale]|eukprot:XP_021882467.1 hypothetical protein BCR41DRAFT_351934 [Lobosporangium transversale]